MPTRDFRIPQNGLFYNQYVNPDYDSLLAKRNREIDMNEARNIVLRSATPRADSSSDGGTKEAVTDTLQLNPYLQQPFRFEPLMSNQPSSVVGGMFSPEISRAAEMQYLQGRQKEMRDRALAFAQLSPMQQADYGFYRGGQQLGDVVGGALGGKDPQLQMIGLQSRILSELDPSDPEQQLRVAQKYARTAPDLAMKIAESARKSMSEIALAEQRKKEAKLRPIVVDGKVVNAETGDVLYSSPVKEKFVVVGNALVAESTGQPIYQGEKPDKYSSFAQKLIEAGLTPNTEPFQRRMLEHINAETKGAGKGTGNVTIGGITIDTGEAGKAAAKVIGANVANIENQFTLEKTIKNAVDLVDKGIYAGAYGPEKGALAKYSLGTIGDKKKVENTEVFMSYIGETVIPRLQEFGGNDSNEELAYLQKVMGGNLRLEPETIRKILINTEKKVQANIKRLQKQAEGGQLSTQPIDVKTPSAPRVTKRLNPNTGKLEPVDGE
jgi:hypothetical protein